ncbi:hypothetical protein LBMAG42_17900 [Deltaproteobacteria bacterium]|nr:hypothetical protein LBMAG42_17900 [Deltaproteobacteria bacterium]
MIAALLLLACADKELAPLKGALDDYSRGRAALEAGEKEAAVAAFVEARRGDPGSAVLALWEARARAATGDVAGAEALATGVIAEHPDAGLAWYNRAAWRVRLGHHDAAADDLRHAIVLGARSPYEAALDEDFRSVLGTAPFLEVLPPAPVVGRTTGPEGNVFLGSDLLVQVELLSAPGVRAELHRSTDSPGCVVLERVVEDQATQAGVLARRIDLHFRASAACSARLAFDVSMTDGSMPPIPMLPVAIQVEAPSSFRQPAPDVLPSRIPLPGSIAPTSGGWTAGRAGGLVWAMGRADVSPTLDGASAPIRLELRVDGSTRAAGGAWPNTSGGTVAAGDWSLAVPPEAP